MRKFVMMLLIMCLFISCSTLRSFVDKHRVNDEVVLIGQQRNLKIVWSEIDKKQEFIRKETDAFMIKGKITSVEKWFYKSDKTHITIVNVVNGDVVSVETVEGGN